MNADKILTIVTSFQLIASVYPLHDASKQEINCNIARLQHSNNNNTPRLPRYAIQSLVLISFKCTRSVVVSKFRDRVLVIKSWQ